MTTCAKTLITLACIGGVTCLGVVAYLIYSVRKNRNKIQAVEDERDKPTIKGISFPMQAFIANVSRFSGSFEPLYHAVNGSTTTNDEKNNLLCDWTIRFMATSCGEEYKSWLDGLCTDEINEKLKKLLKEVLKCGVTRDDKTTFIVDDASIKEYIEWEGVELKKGDKVRVASAAWKLNGICIEKGIVSKIQ